MNNLPKAKRDQLILVVVVTLMIIGALVFFVIDMQHSELKRTQLKTESMRAKLLQADQLSRTEPDLQVRLQKVVKDLSGKETFLAPDHDTYAWLLQNLAQFLSVHRGAGITPSGISQPDIAETTLIPRFAYKQATFHVKGAGYFHDVGRFVADLENEFPYVRVQNIEMSRVVGGTVGTDGEKLNVSFDMVMLMQPSTPIENR
jgi:Tfp pilus assembly protein PilO